MKKSHILLGIIGSVIVLYSAISLYLYKKSLTKDEFFKENKVAHLYILCDSDQATCKNIHHVLVHEYYGQYAVQLYIGIGDNVIIPNGESVIHVLKDGKIECVQKQDFCLDFEERKIDFNRYHKK